MCEVKLHKVEAISIGPEGPEMTPFTYLWIRNAHFRYKQPVINGTEIMALVHNGPGPNGPGPNGPGLKISEIVPVKNGLVGPKVPV